MKKNKSVRGLILISLMSLVPVVALAATGITAGADVTKGIGTFGSIIDTFTQSIVRSLATLFATAAMAAFFFGIVQFIWGSREGDATKSKNGKNFMVWGLVALFVMFSVWGIVIYTQKIFGIDGQSTILIPDIKIQNSSSSVAPSPLGTGGTAGGAGTGGTGGTATAKPNGWDCSSNAGCASGFCDPTDNVCTASGGGNKKPNGWDCSNNAECVSNYCDAADNTCSAVPGVSSGGNGNTPVGYCGDGSPYYSASDAKFCQSGTNTGGTSCGSITDAQTCDSMGCSWDNAELVCSR